MKRKNIPKCPNCHSRNLQFIEIVSNGEVFDMDPHTGDLEYLEPMPMSHSEGVRGECENCNHSWKLKGVLQITDLPNASKNGRPL